MPNQLKSKKQRLLMALPIFLIPAGLIIYLGFSVFHPQLSKIAGNRVVGGFNEKLPVPNLQPSDKNKLELYMEAERDSMKKEDAISQDPYAKRLYDPAPTGADGLPAQVKRLTVEQAEKKSRDSSHLAAVEPNEKKVNDRLEKLYAVIKQTAHADSTKKNLPETHAVAGFTSQATDRIEGLIASLHQKDTGTDPKMDQLSAMLDKIMAIQHPQLLSETPAFKAHHEESKSLSVSTVSPIIDKTDWTEPDGNLETETTGIGFYGWNEPVDTLPKDNGTILAAIHTDQMVHTGSSVNIRLLQNIYIGNIRIEKGSFLTGKCTIEGERVNIQLTNINYNNQIIPIQLKVFDTDGLEGVSVPGTLSRDAAKEGLSQGIGSVGVGSLDPSLAGQATAATIESAKTLLSRKARLIEAVLKADHKVLLKKA